jgi:hypothetical protein
MQARASWKRSLKLCTPEALKTFALLTLKATRDALYVLMTPWILIPLGLVLGLYFFGLTTELSLKLLSLVFSVLFILAARPSIEIKDFAYFKKNIVRSLVITAALIPFLLLWVLVGIAGVQLVYGGSLHANHVINLIMIVLLYAIATLIIMPFMFILFFVQNFALLFYLDRTEGVLIAYKRALTMYWYNLPAIGIYSLSFGVISLVMYVLCAMLFQLFFNPSSWFFTLFILMQQLLRTLFNLGFFCLMTNLYIKLVHEQYELYFPEDMQNNG